MALPEEDLPTVKRLLHYAIRDIERRIAEQDNLMAFFKPGVEPHKIAANRKKLLETDLDDARVLILRIK